MPEMRPSSGEKSGSKAAAKPAGKQGTKHKDLREQLLEEVHADGTEAALQWIQSRWKVWAAMASVCIVAVLAYSGWLSLAEKREKQGQAALAACVKAGSGSAEQAESGIATCDAVVTEHRGTAAARQARLVKSALLVRSGKAADGAEVLTSLVGDMPSADPLLPVARLALARAQEAAGKPADAATTYKALQTEGFTLDEVTTLDLVRVLDASGQRDEAKKLLEDQIAKAGDGPQAGPAASQLRARLALLSMPASPAPEPVKN